jgi:hypothetical protein
LVGAYYIQQPAAVLAYWTFVAFILFVLIRSPFYLKYGRHRHIFPQIFGSNVLAHAKHYLISNLSKMKKNKIE